jgi:hypothetical protein
MTSPLVCRRCAAPLPNPGEGSYFVGCSYCGTTHRVAPEERSDASKQIYAAADQAWEEARAHSSDPVVALRAVVLARSAALQTQEEAERATRLGEALLVGFDQKNGSETTRDKMCVLRIGEIAVKSIVTMRTAESTEVNLPFFYATANGPQHLMLTITRETLAGFDRLGDFTAAAPPPVESEEGKPKKKGWWPFGG